MFCCKFSIVHVWENAKIIWILNMFPASENFTNNIYQVNNIGMNIIKIDVDFLGLFLFAFLYNVLCVWCYFFRLIPVPWSSQSLHFALFFILIITFATYCWNVFQIQQKMTFDFFEALNWKNLTLKWFIFWYEWSHLLSSSLFFLLIFIFFLYYYISHVCWSE